MKQGYFVAGSPDAQFAMRAPHRFKSGQTGTGLANRNTAEQANRVII
jgi:hypothetical protein